MSDIKNEQKAGFAYIMTAVLIWGFLPSYLKMLVHVDTILILANRIVWAAVIMLLLIIIFYKKEDLLIPLKQKRNILLFSLAGLTVLSQWVFYIFAITTSHILEISLGYYIYPVLAVIFSRLIFREKLSVNTLIAFFLALTGVLILIFGYGNIPVQGLGIAFSFTFYSLVKKKLTVPSVISTFYEMLFLLPFALVYMIYMESTGRGAFTGFASDPVTPLLLVGAGLLTCVTLMTFASGAKRISMTAIGFIQYLSPTIAMITAVFIFGEEFSTAHWLSFGLIWVAILIYTFPGIRQLVVKEQKV